MKRSSGKVPEPHDGTRATTLRGRAAELARLPVVPNLRAISIAEGLRAALSVSVIMAANSYFAWPPLGEAALAALLTCLCDTGGPIRRRVPVLLSFAIAGALATVGIGLARNLGPPAALALTLAALFAATFIRIYGQAAQQFGMLLSVVIVFAFDRALPNLHVAALLAASFVGGGLWATLLTLVIWRVHPYLPARHAVADAYRRLAMLVADLRTLRTGGATEDHAWATHTRAQRRAVREAIETARSAVLGTMRSRGVGNHRARQSLLRLEAAEQIFGALIALSDLLEADSAMRQRAVDRVLRRLGPALLVLARAIPGDNAMATRRVGRALDAMMMDLQALPEVHPLHPILNRIAERLRVACTLTDPQNLVPGSVSNGDPLPLAQRLREPLVTNLNLRSPELRYALRVVTMAAPALVFTLLWFTPFDHWLTITIIATMQPYYALTYARALERIAGTALGGLLGAGIGLVCTTPLSIAVAMFPLAVIALGLRAVSLGFFMLGLTPLVVLLVEALEPHTSEWLIAGARALFTIVGGILAVAGSFLLWPNRAAEELTRDVQDAILAHGRYAEAELSHLLGEAEAAAVEAARRAAGLSSNSLEASISRALMEPGRTAHDRLEAALVIDAALRRCAGRIAALPFDRASVAGIPAAALRDWRTWIGGTLRSLAAGDATPAVRPAASGSDSLLRLARQLELVAGVVQRIRDAA